MAKASGSIDLKSLKVAGEPNKYVTMIDGSGIRVHEAGAVNTNFAQINSNGMQIYKGGSADSNIVASFGDSIRVGKTNYGHIDIEADGLTVRGNQDGSQLSPSNDYYTYLTSRAVFIGGGGADVASLDMGGSCTHIDVSTNSTSNWTNIYTQTEGGYYHPDTAITQIGAVNSSGHWGSIDIQSTDRTGVDETTIGLQAQSIHANGDFYIKNHDSPVGTMLSNSASVAITTANINTYAVGPGITLSPGSWIIRGMWQYNSATGARVIDVDLATDNSTSASTTTLIGRQRVSNANGAWARLEVISLATPTTDTSVYVKGSATLTSTAQACYIYAMRIA